ncbi:hypothetical protein Bca4012_088702 [Brassica carinata]
MVSFCMPLDFNHNSAAKILVEVELSKGFPSRIADNDENGFISMVDVDYAWLPSKCERCGQLGYKIKHCLESVTKSHIVATDVSENSSNGSTVVVETNKLPKSAQPDTSLVQTSAVTIHEICLGNIIISYGEFLHATGFQPQQAAKILVEVELSKGFPSRIAANDENGFISMVDVDYAWLPSKCERCGQLGYKIKHCLESVTKSHIVATDVSENPSNCSTVVVETNKLLKSAQSALL